MSLLCSPEKWPGTEPDTWPSLLLFKAKIIVTLKAELSLSPKLNSKLPKAQPLSSNQTLSRSLNLPDWICWVCHIDDDDLVSLADLFSDADEFVRFHGEGVEPDVGSIDTNIGQLELNHQ